MRTLVTTIVVLAIVGIVAPPSRAACPNAPPAFTQPGKSVSKTVRVPNVAPAAVAGSFAGTLVRPRRIQKGKRLPAVVVMHGNGANQCSLWWVAKFLAGRGYVTLTVDQPVKSDPDLHLAAVVSGVRYLRKSSNPFAAYIAKNNLGLTGHSGGTWAIATAQQTEPSVNAIVALDNLPAFETFDPGSAVGCHSPDGAITPKVPALGMAMDLPCAMPYTGGGPIPVPPYEETKKGGFGAWKAAGLPTMELVLRGFVHNDFASGPDARRRLIGYFMLNWFERWLKKRPAAGARLLAPSVFGTPIADIVATQFRSGAFIPGRIDCETYPACP